MGKWCDHHGNVDTSPWLQDMTTRTLGICDLWRVFSLSCQLNDLQDLLVVWEAMCLQLGKDQLAIDCHLKG